MRCEICKQKAEAIIRGVDVCKTCFFLLKKDNKQNPKSHGLKIERHCIRCNTSEFVDIKYIKTYQGIKVKPFYCGSCK